MGGFGINLSTAGLGLGTGINVQSTVAQLTASAEAGEQVYLDEQQLYTNQTSALNNINGLLSTLQTSVQTLQDPAGQLAARVVTSSNSSVVTASATAGAAVGNHTINVSNLASTSTLASTPLSASTTLTIGGQLTFQIGSDPTNTRTITIDSSNDTLSTLASYINSNSQTYGVTANVITDTTGSTLTLASTTGGTAGNLTVNSDTTGLGTTQVVPGNDAVIYVDGVKVTSATNTLTGDMTGLTGVTLNLSGASGSPTSITTIGIAPDTNQATSAINSFVSAYNAVAQAINAQFTYTPGTTTQAPLYSDNTLSQVQSTLASDVNYAFGPNTNNGITGLASIGVNLQQDGTISVDSSTLSAALTNNFSSVQAYFQQIGTTDSNGSVLTPNGFAVNLSNDLTKMTDPTTGPLNMELQGISSEQNDVTQSINDFNYNLQQQQQQWTTEYSQVDTTLQTLPLLIQQITGQLGGSAA